MTTTLSTTSFADLGVPTAMTSVLDKLGLTSPFPIQQATLPDSMAGRDVCGRAPTGSGKTLAFALPIATRVERGTSGRPRALILVPTRELASQVRDTLLPLAQKRQRRVMTIYGGTNIRTDQHRLRKGVDIVVATPGRLSDLVRRGNISLADVDLVVLDEADRMADMGFLPEVRRLLDATSPNRQTLLFSATLDGEVDVLIRNYQHDPARHEVTVPEEELGAIRHVFFHAERSDRRALTGRIVKGRGPAIVFSRTKHGADRLAKQLASDGISTAAIHGNRSQGQRERALDGFQRGTVSTLVATDVAARGIHVDNVAVVVHYDLPATDKDYVHRSGRTGRAGADGLVVSLVGNDQRKDLDAIQRSVGLPQGFHTTDLTVLDAEELPAPTPPAARPGGGARREAGRGNGRRPNSADRRRTRPGRGKPSASGRPNRSKPSNAGAPRGDGSSVGNQAGAGEPDAGSRASHGKPTGGARPHNRARTNGGARHSGRGKPGAGQRSGGGRPEAGTRSGSRRAR